MNKIRVVISCPIDTYSGYGARSRDFVKALLKLEKYDIQILSQRWGNTRFGYLKNHNELELKSLITPKLNFKPDIWIQITVPNEFQNVGTYNIGITAGIETTLCDSSWIEGCNRMNLILASSTHSKVVLENTIYEVKDNTTGQITSTIKCTTPIEILLEGVDIETYKPIQSSFNLDSISEQFCFLFVGHWMQGDLGHDRKNVGYLVKTFLESYKNKLNKPALILKTSTSTSSILDREKVLDKIDSIRKTVKGTLPNIYLIHGDLTDQEINNLYNHPKIKAMISLTKGEGFGRPLAEFALTGKPVIASGWSGHIDFLKPDMSVLIPGELENVHPSAAAKNIILTDSKWFKPDDTQVGKAFKGMYSNYKDYVHGAKRQKNFIKENFSFDTMVKVLDQTLSKYLPDFPKQVELKLPKLKLPNLQ